MLVYFKMIFVSHVGISIFSLYKLFNSLETFVMEAYNEWRGNSWLFKIFWNWGSYFILDVSLEEKPCPNSLLIMDSNKWGDFCKSFLKISFAFSDSSYSQRPNSFIFDIIYYSGLFISSFISSFIILTSDNSFFVACSF